MKISLIYNCDTRPQNNEFGGNNLQGVCNSDFITDGLYNVKKFLSGFDVETIMVIDEHLQLSESDLAYVRKNTDCLLIRKHTDEPKFNDWNYWRSLMLASGDIIIKIDQDTACFANSSEPIQNLINLLEQYDYISYPSMWTPRAHTASEYDYMWCSTRFMMCKRETLDFTEIKKCLEDSDYLFNKYPASIQNPWMEHVIGLISKYNGKGVYYPPIEEDNYLVFSWAFYEKCTLRRLNELPYNEVKAWVTERGIYYPVDVRC